MKNIIQRQSESISVFDINKLCSIDTEVVEAATSPLIHQSARFLFIQEGRAVLKIQGKNYEINKQNVVMIFPWEITEIISVTETLRFRIVKYKSDILSLIASALGLSDEADKKIFKNLEQKHVIPIGQAQEWEKVMRIMEELEEELGLESVNAKETTDAYSGILCVSQLLKLLIQLERAMEGDKRIEDTGAFDKSEILRYIYLHLGEKVSVEMLAKKFYISQSSVRRYILDMTGLTFNDLLNEMRIGKTANYLLYTDFTIDELAGILGYVDASHISRIFQARVGMRINEYRKCYQKVQILCHVPEIRMSYSIVNYISRNYYQRLTARSVAEMFNISIRKLNQILVYQSGRGFPDFLDYIRINMACKMLLETNKSITDIAYAVGYREIKTFNRKFINKKLMPPSQFRREVRYEEEE